MKKPCPCGPQGQSRVTRSRLQRWAMVMWSVMAWFNVYAYQMWTLHVVKIKNTTGKVKVSGQMHIQTNKPKTTCSHHCNPGCNNHFYNMPIKSHYVINAAMVQHFFRISTLNLFCFNVMDITCNVVVQCQKLMQPVVR